MKGNLPRCLEYVLEDEGGFAVVATEPGGSVNLGVSMETFETWRKRTGRTSTLDELRDLSKEEAAEIYDFLYWQAINGDTLEAGVDYIALDIAINSGVSASRKIMAEAAAVIHPKSVIDRACQLRLERMIANPNWEKYHRGWMRRVERSRQRAYQMVIENKP